MSTKPVKDRSVKVALPADAALVLVPPSVAVFPFAPVVVEATIFPVAVVTLLSASTIETIG